MYGDDQGRRQVRGQGLSVNCESRNTKLNMRGFGDYIHLEKNK
jgi:hypothetical protein